MDERTFPGPWSFDGDILDANRRVIAYVVAREEAWRDARIISSLPKKQEGVAVSKSWWKWLTRRSD
jgi:hypothetical protein